MLVPKKPDELHLRMADILDLMTIVHTVAPMERDRQRLRMVDIPVAKKVDTLVPKKAHRSVQRKPGQLRLKMVHIPVVKTAVRTLVQTKVRMSVLKKLDRQHLKMADIPVVKTVVHMSVLMKVCMSVLKKLGWVHSRAGIPVSTMVARTV